jgi:hypothetical protein
MTFLRKSLNSCLYIQWHITIDVPEFILRRCTGCHKSRFTEITAMLQETLFYLQISAYKYQMYIKQGGKQLEQVLQLLMSLYAACWF